MHHLPGPVHLAREVTGGDEGREAGEVGEEPGAAGRLVLRGSCSICRDKVGRPPLTIVRLHVNIRVRPTPQKLGGVWALA